MSASDSDYSIDWLASDDEDNDSELEQDCTKAEGQTTLPKAPCSAVIQGAQTCQPIPKWNGVKGEVKDKENMSSLGCSPSCDSSDLCNDSGLSHFGQGDRSIYSRCADIPKGNKRHVLKRTRSSMVLEHRERQLTPEQKEKDRLFACKCLELHCYIHPLSSILNGLRSGRYRERLSTFQESVAMDRIQRIMGVLQNPCMGERYVNIIFKMEEMLKNWFPHIKPQRSDQANTADLMEMTLSKKPKLTPAASALIIGIANPATTSAPSMGSKTMRVSDLTPPGPYSATNLKWLHTTPICSPTADQAQGTVRNFLTANRDKDVTQDSSVSSSTDSLCSKTDSTPSRPLPGKINAPCLERLLKSTESIITQKGSVGMGGMAAGSWS